MAILLKQLKFHLDTFRRRDEGATMIEYGLLAALIAVVLIGTIAALGGALDGIFGDAEDALDDPEGEQ